MGFKTFLNRNKFLLILSTITVLFILLVAPVYAQIEYDSGVEGLEPITLPTFFSISQIENFSIFSYISFAFSLIFLGITLFWVFLIIRAAVKIIQSSGNAEQMQEAYKSLGSVFWSVTLLFGFFVVIILVTSFFGLGNFLQWPQYLSRCQDGELYITKILENPEEKEEITKNRCFPPDLIREGDPRNTRRQPTR